MKELESIRKININFKIVFGKATFDGMLRVLYDLANGRDIAIINMLWIMGHEPKCVIMWHKHELCIILMIEWENLFQIPLQIYLLNSWLSVQFSHSVVSYSLQPHESQHARPPCPSPTPRVYSNSCPLSWWCHPTVSSSVVPFSSCPQSFPASGSFQMSQLFTSGGQSIGASASTRELNKVFPSWGKGEKSQGWETSDPLQGLCPPSQPK